MMTRIVTVFLLFALLPTAAFAQKRVALVIGNSAYKHAGVLANPKNDATDMAAALKKHGFQVIDGFDLDKAALDRRIRDFATALVGAEVGVFFYAGHGLQVAGHNYIVPIDAQLTTAAALDFEMVRLDLVHRTMEREAQTNVIFIDACRDNPLARNLARAMGTRSGEIGRGLAAVESGVGTLISFSTQPGNVALDGTGRNSPFAGALVKHMSGSADDLSALLIAVRNDVMKETQRKQVPWEHSALTGRFYFNPGSQTAAPPHVAPARLSEAAEAWAATKDTTRITVLEAFIARYKDTFYAELARARIEQLNKEQVAIAAPPPKATPAPSAVTPQAAPRPPKPLTSVEERALKPKDSFKECNDCSDMVVIPAGEFRMGSTEEPNEQPVRKVTIARPFAVGRFEVTFAEWDACVAAGGCKRRPEDQGWGRERRPVVNVSWDEVTKEYLVWLRQKSGKTYRLLTEAEWEYAARASTTTVYSWGNDIGENNANCNGCGSQWDGKQTAPVGSFRPNAFGLHDLHGNAWEWVEDCYRDSYANSAPDGSAALELEGCSRVLRGGSWLGAPRVLRSAVRGGYQPDFHFGNGGFRVARALD